MSERDLDCITDLLDLIPKELNAQLLKALQESLRLSQEFLSEVLDYKSRFQPGATQRPSDVAELLAINLKFKELISEKDDQIAKLRKLM